VPVPKKQERVHIYVSSLYSQEHKYKTRLGLGSQLGDRWTYNLSRAEFYFKLSSFFFKTM
jgi:hypothetical protein